ncbi:PA3496 family putative envelope integrity protein [Kushneria phosphatilytica]|uniref:PA3496 family putative envelope integrity protein n=1 Tax=Kushneria phosphatilytica TaxID=657387 RepID=UPI0008D9ED36|nr:hypothetical protein [Kushneria phosphatilytica]OHV08868.1 hypothetical protein BH688_12735 [Kushneria phosphatilytica]
MKNATLNDLKNDLLGIAMELEAEAADQRRHTAAQRHLRARRGIEYHYESRQLASDLSLIPLDSDSALPPRRAMTWLQLTEPLRHRLDDTGTQRQTG